MAVRLIQAVNGSYIAVYQSPLSIELYRKGVSLVFGKKEACVVSLIFWYLANLSGLRLNQTLSDIVAFEYP